tara:strand:- start:2952 stop:3578 length:627 start_codon:yes stop_codon:yes gene_type:complete
MKGKLITIEGVEGVGKSTNINFISSYMESKNIKHLCTREPGGTVNAEKIRDILLHSEEEKVPEIAELLLFFSARSFHIENVIIPALINGINVICDRFADATIAYQGNGRGFDIKQINQISKWVQNDLKPNLTILLDAPAEVGMKRTKIREKNDRMESEKISFYERVRQGYLNIARNDPERVVIVDATKDILSVEKNIEKHLNHLFSEK